MTRRARFTSALGRNTVLVALGSLFVVLAAGWAMIRAADGSRLTTALLVFLLTGGPWLLVLYGGYRLPSTELRPDVYPRIVAWCLGGFGVLLAVIGLVHVTSPAGIDRPVFSILLATGLGSVSGVGIGMNEARSVSRAREAERHRDEAERHRDELLRERNLRDRIVQTSPIGIVIINTDGSIRMANEHAAQIAGLSTEELEAIDAANDSMFQATDAEGNTIGEGLFKEILRTGDAIYDVERQITRADGERIWVTVNGAPLVDSSGDVMAAVIAAKDMTEHKRLERELKETVDKLQTSNERLEESNQRLEQFAYAASHDLQEPLRMVSSYLQMIESRYSDELDEDGREFLDFAVDGADRMRDMIEGLLQYSRVDTQGDPFEPVDLEAVVDDACADLQMKIEEHDADITVEDLPRVRGDEDQLRQVFQNLLDNAIEYSGDDSPRVHISAERSGDEWAISVRDEGIGIDPEQSDRIFEVFQRLHNQDEHAGTGIGLALCERIVERHGGEIWVDSEPGDGSTFYFTLHKADTELEPAPQPDLRR